MISGSMLTYHLLVQRQGHLIYEVNDAIKGVRHPKGSSPLFSFHARKTSIRRPIGRIHLMQLHQLHQPNTVIRRARLQAAIVNYRKQRPALNQPRSKLTCMISYMAKRIHAWTSSIGAASVMMFTSHSSNSARVWL
jgi:hypothetical protein